MSHFRNPAANTIRTLCPPWCWPGTPEDREGDERWVVLASAGGIRPSTPLGPDDFGKLILHYNAIMSLYCFYTLEVQGEEGFVVQFDRVQQCWKQPMGLQTAVGNPAVAFPVEVCNLSGEILRLQRTEHFLRGFRRIPCRVMGLCQMHHCCLV